MINSVASRGIGQGIHLLKGLDLAAQIGLNIRVPLIEAGGVNGLVAREEINVVRKSLGETPFAASISSQRGIPQVLSTTVFVLLGRVYSLVSFSVRRRCRARCNRTAMASRLLPILSAISADERPSTLAMRITSR